MSTYMRVVGGVVVELFQVPDGQSIGNVLHPQVASMFVVAPSGAQVGSTATFSNETWSTSAPTTIVFLQPDIRNQLKILDDKVPRSVEDMIVAFALDHTKLPTVTQTILTEKSTLRAQLQTLISNNTP